MSVPTLVTLTVAPGTVPPLESVTVPEMRPVMVCAKAPILKQLQMTSRSDTAKGVILRFIAFLHCWVNCCGRASGPDINYLVTLRLKGPNVPAKPGIA